jgi:hypothetical protein
MNLSDIASSVAILQATFKDSNESTALKSDLAYIHAKFSFQSQSITRSEKNTNLSSERAKQINDIQEKLNKFKRPKNYAIKQKFRRCFGKNEEF